MTHGRADFGAFFCRDYIYTFGGKYASEALQQIQVLNNADFYFMERYDIRMNKWTPLKDDSQRRSGFAYGVVDFNQL